MKIFVIDVSLDKEVCSKFWKSGSDPDWFHLGGGLHSLCAFVDNVELL